MERQGGISGRFLLPGIRAASLNLSYVPCRGCTAVPPDVSGEVFRAFDAYFGERPVMSSMLTPSGILCKSFPVALWGSSGRKTQWRGRL